jgi:hypothetical protein
VVPISIALAVLGLAGMGWWWQQRQHQFEGALPGDVAGQASVSGVIAESSAKLPKADWAAIRRALEHSPAELRSPMMRIRLQAAPRGIKLTLTPGEFFELVSVDVRSLPGLAEFANSAAERFDGPRRQALAAGLAGMAKAISAAVVAGRSADLSEFGVPVGVNGLVGGLGYHLQAVVDRKGYICVFEDRQQRLYFLVPAGVEQFELRERTIADQPSPFPTRVRMTVSVERRTVTPESTDDESAPAATEEPEAPSESAAPTGAAESLEAETGSDARSPDVPAKSM